MSSACKNVNWNKLGALLSGKILQTVECTNNIHVDLVWGCLLDKCYDDVRRSNIPPGIYHLGLTLKLIKVIIGINLEK